jgi:hypothetical protein
VCAVSLTGCLPFVVPPMRVSAGAGPAFGSFERPVGTVRPRAVANLRAGFHPLSLRQRAARRPFDIGAGYGVDLLSATHPTTIHGPYLEVGYYPVRAPLGSSTTFRWGGRGAFELLRLNDRFGYGGTLITEVELSGDTQGTFAGTGDDGTMTAGAAHGQWAIGAYVGGSGRDFRDGAYGAITLGLSARIPFLAGVMCCFWGDDDDDDGGATPSYALPTRRRERSREPAPREHVPAKPTRPASPTRTRPHVPARPKPVDDDS